MVLIEVADEDCHTNPPKTSSATIEEANSDGFETASDGGVDSEDDGEIASGSDQKQQHNQREKQGIEKPDEQAKETVPDKDSCRKISDDEELEQKAVAKANDAKLEGNRLFVDGQYELALLQYELALQIAPEIDSTVDLRSICYSNRAICFLKLGKYEETVKECTKSLELNPTYMKSLIRRAEANEKLEHYEEAIADLKKILELDPSNVQARKTIRHLEPLAEQKREKMKEEMIGKLKEMGNSLLGKFGMSIDNFKAVKDPNTGSYSVSFQQ